MSLSTEGYRWYHPGVTVVPLALVDPVGNVQVVCLTCGRGVRDDRRDGWVHYDR